ncbi:hypothetical protein [Rhodococcus sp. 11-3]|uniref:hypothetical protein n=1 Tax=Rhodococcus sp. 11-3 TaxID=2854796 RepID=UPI00203CB919|nr:hypothetical protein [Rhodococcus sp. 11-3]USC16990.1 hypothetical protein KZJ41_09045 [Rhodococcus sp. 11-3]
MPDSRKIVGAFIKHVADVTGLDVNDIIDIRLSSERFVDVSFIVTGADGKPILTGQHGYAIGIRTGPMVWDTADLE